MDTNLIGPALLTDELLPLLSASPHPERKIVFVSSKLGSINSTWNQAERGNVDLRAVTAFTEYAASKAALNLYAKHLSWRLGHSEEAGGKGGEQEGQKKKWKVNVVCPGYTKTNLNNYRGTQEPSEAAEIVARVVKEEGGETGTFRDREGVVPW